MTDRSAEPSAIQQLGGEAQHSLTAVLGFDLTSQTVVFPSDETRESWHRRTAHVVCFGCYTGSELTTPGTLTPLIYRHGDHRQRHFAHPAGRSPCGDGLRGETLWHIEAKENLRRWALAQPGVVSASCEWTITGRARRADVIVLLDDGRRIALEAQRRRLPQTEWHARRNSYHSQDITDIWFWSTEVAHPHAADDPRTSVIIDPPCRRLGLIVGRRPKPDLRWYDQDLRDYVAHWPPKPGDTLLVAWAPIDHWTLEHGSLHPPDSLQQLRNPDLTQITAAAAAARQERQQFWQQRRARANASARARAQGTAVQRRQQRSYLAPPLPKRRTTRHPGTPNLSRSSSRPTCRVCGTVLADVLASQGVHILCAAA